MAVLFKATHRHLPFRKVYLNKMAKEPQTKEDLWNEENIPSSNFFKFDKIGARVSGNLVAVEDKPGKDGFGPQRVFSLKQEDGSIFKVGISLAKDYVIGRANSAKMGDLVGFEYKKDVPSTRGKGFAAAKSIEVYVK